MAYNDLWSSLNVLGSTPARDIDDKFRLFKRALEERLETYLVKDVNADPWEPPDELAGTIEGKKLFIGPAAFREHNSSVKATELNDSFLTCFHGSGKIITPVMLPAGVTIKLIEFLVNRGDVTGILWHLNTINFDSPATVAEVASNTDTVAGLHVHSQALNHTVVDSALYQLDLHSTGGVLTTPSWFFYGVRITYDTPDSTKTI